MHVGRNDPCPCGSGKKYKKCCLSKDREVAPDFIPPAVSRRAVSTAADVQVAQRKLPPPQTPAATPPAKPVDPRIEALNARWEEFESRDYEGQIELFVKTLDDEALMDAEMAFSMLNELHIPSLKRADADRFDILANALRERRPNIYAENAIYIVPWLVSNALAARRFEEVQRLAIEVATIADDNIDLFVHAIDELAYHGRLATLVESMRIAWPRVKDSQEVTAWGISEFATRAAGYEIFAYLESAASPDANDPTLTERLAFYLDAINLDFVTRFIDQLTGRASRTWTLADFHELRKRKKKAHDWDDDEPEDKATPSELQSLTAEFVGYLRRVEGVSYSKGELGRHYLMRYLRRRAAGDLEPRDSMLDQMLRPRKQMPNRPQRKDDHLLCPDRETMDCFLAGLTSFMVSGYHGLAATMELLPAWLRFLESRQLLDAPKRIKTLAEFAMLRDDVRKLLSTFYADPSLQQNVETAWQDEPLPAASP